jgi:hypothetical protein
MAAKVTERKNSIINSSGSPSGLLAHSSMRQGATLRARASR